MKNLVKKWWFLTIIVIIICSIIISITIMNKKEGIGTSGISKEEFKEIELGMSQFKVNEIIDKLDEWDNNSVYEKACEEISKSHKDSIYTYQYKYYGEKSGYAIITFEADYTETIIGVFPEVIKKEQFNLK